MDWIQTAGAGTQLPENNIKIAVFGIGGAGNNIIDDMLRMHPELQTANVQFFALNTDLQHLKTKRYVQNKAVIQFEESKGLGVGGDPQKGAVLAHHFLEQFHKLSDSFDFCILVAGFGKGTGTGATPVFSKFLSNKGVLNLSIVSYPAMCEGLKAREKAAKGLERLNQATDSFMLFRNDRCTDGIYQLANVAIVKTIKNIIELINLPLQQNIDFEDIRSFFKKPAQRLENEANLFRVTNTFTFSFDAHNTIEHFSHKLKNFEYEGFFDHKVEGAQKVILKVLVNQGLYPLDLTQIQEIIWAKIDNHNLEVQLGVDFTDANPSVQLFFLMEKKQAVSSDFIQKPAFISVKEVNQKPAKPFQVLNDLKELGLKYVKQQTGFNY
ncbi:cell division protein FtsZ [Mycoplasmoides pneumoniae]|uniref:Cell division protein FtsZ n=2 Tax=Mycoplasmoides pneumoniae TaxID=2104 RepID=FTSZ_MYCPN|nr:cell division protein FtsZ [Mycoplasmoides pneumoniae]P75464.1 RecName: Full=Cell division protein FtsZ [Mycoplasmoides pneumoniae M129]AAB96167.1 cell division protein FtsZ [Mycoplasmoides pneumoniae M129]AGC04236.1 cell division protein FtsZ [Mycoplasmoides pneumoniae M129-B7]ALA30199.1 cell division protein FtsZ [Mycoplasmoides pneumoniae PI 1428]ALA31151.1 cell division protein FtsZ [Mycoplasmoides pneumoniae 19294]ALA31597.1 cell division protein FtsZ [Mycoplasmoides pneumoniae 39443]